MERYQYTTEERADIHFVYGLANGNADAAQRLYHERYPNRVIPNPRTFTNIHRRLRETGATQVRSANTNNECTYA